MKSIFVGVFSSLVYYGAMFGALYALEFHDMRGPWHLVVGWVVLVAGIVLGLLVCWFFVPEEIAEHLNGDKTPMWRRKLNRVLSVAFLVALVWYGHVFVASVYAVTCFVFYLLMAAAREVREAGYGH